MSASRARAFQILERWEVGDYRATIVNSIIIGTISISVAATVLSTVPTIAQDRAALLWTIEVFALSVFVVEYGVRLWANSGRQPIWRYILSPLSIIDLLAILPPLLALGGTDLMVLRLIRLLRMLKLVRYFAPLSILLQVIEAELKSLFAIILLLGLLTLFAATAVYWAEHAAQPDDFGSIPQAMWWSVVTLTTVGYGDVTPVTPVGRLFGTVIMVLGIGMVALPAGMLASRFSDELAARREIFRRAAAGKADKTDAELKVLRERLALSEQDAADLHPAPLPTDDTRCPHCGKAITP